MSQTLKYLQEVLAIPSPTGFTKEVQEYLLAKAKEFGFPVKHTAKGLVIMTVKGKDDEHQRMLTAHVDTLGQVERSLKARTDRRLSLEHGRGRELHSAHG